MKKTLALAAALFYLCSLPALAQESASGESLNASLQDASRESTAQSTQSTTDNSDTSSQTSLQESTAQSTEQTSQGSSTADGSGTATLIVSGALVAIGLTAGGIILTVRASKVKAKEVVELQDQIYRGQGPDYEKLLLYFKLSERDIVRANDELVNAGNQIVDEQSAADYLAKLILLLARASPSIVATAEG